MAKKTVATLQTGSKKFTKVIKIKKSPKSGAYTFEERIVNAELAKDYFKK